MKPGKQKLAERALVRAQTGLHFLDECLWNRHGGTDPAFSRSWYILMTYNFELIINTLLILSSSKQTNEEIIKEIMSIKPAHDFKKLAGHVSREILDSVGINKISKRSVGGFIEYEVYLADGNHIILQDIVDVRYDFKKASLRRVVRDEVSRIKKELESLHTIVGKTFKLL